MDNDQIKNTVPTQPSIPSGIINRMTAQPAPPVAPARVISSDAVDVGIPPSRSIFYDDKSRFMMKPLTVEEEKIFATAQFVKDGTALDKVIQSCLESPVIPVNSLLMCDKVFLMVKLRQITYGNNYDLNVTCAACGNKYVDSLDISKLPVMYLDEFVTADNLVTTLPMSKHVIQYRLLTSGDESQIDKMQKARMQTKSKKNAIDESMVDRMIMSIVTIDGKDMNDEDLAKVLSKLHAVDSEHFRDEILAKSMGVGFEIISECGCGHENTMMMPLSENFFRSNRRKLAPTKI
jgi:hypothetical protein